MNQAMIDAVQATSIAHEYAKAHNLLNVTFTGQSDDKFHFDYEEPSGDSLDIENIETVGWPEVICVDRKTGEVTLERVYTGGASDIS